VKYSLTPADKAPDDEENDLKRVSELYEMLFFLPTNGTCHFLAKDVISDFNIKFIKLWLKTENFRLWNESTKPEISNFIKYVIERCGED
jgi:hypothetical protein